MPKIFIPTLDAPPSGIAADDLLVLSDVDDAAYPAGTGKTVKISITDLAFALGITGAGLFGAGNSILNRLTALENGKANTDHSHPHSH